MTGPRINIIVAICNDNAIGRKGDLIHHVGADLKRFKALTMGHPIIMGRKTFESLPKGALPGRRNIVVSRSRDFSAPNAEVFPNLEDAVAACAGCDNIYIIGGAQIYSLALPFAQCLLLTRFNEVCPDADCHFPDIDADVWTTEESLGWICDEKTGVEYKFETLVRES